jgi:FKBP-type peptidyl-prolyl cis-trans isomerase FklB
MKKIAALVSASLMTVAMMGSVFAADTTAASATKTTTQTAKVKTDMAKVSYTIGYEIGNGFHTQNIDLNTNAFNDALQAGLSGKDPKYTKEEMQTTMQAFQKEMMEKAVEKQKEQAINNLTASKTYLSTVAKEEGVKELETGIYYKVVKAGNGEIPTATDTVKVNYEGKLSDGKVFDSSYERKEPATFEVNKVIPCWTKALEKMPVGSTWTLYCSPEEAYGLYAPPSIGPNQVLTFKVELLSIEKAAATPGSAAIQKVDATTASK